MQIKLTESRPMPRVAIFISVFALVVATVAAQAHDGATGAIKERMDAMEAIEDAMDAIAKARTAGDWDAADVKVKAQIIAGHADGFVALFPQGSDHKPSRAKPAVWTQPDDFAAHAELLKKGGQIMAGAMSEAEFEQGFAAAGSTCRACHSVYKSRW